MWTFDIAAALSWVFWQTFVSYLFGPRGESKVSRKKTVSLFFGGLHPKSYCVRDGDDTVGDGDGDGDDDAGNGDLVADDGGDDDGDGGEDDDDGEEVVGTELALAPSLEPHSQWWAPTSLGLSSW